MLDHIDPRTDRPSQGAGAGGPALLRWVKCGCTDLGVSNCLVKGQDRPRWGAPDTVPHQIQVVERKLSRHDKQLGWRRRGNARPWTDRGQTVEPPKKGVERPKRSRERPKMSMDRVPHKGLTLGTKFRSLVLWRDAWFWLSWYFLIQILQQIGRSSVRNLKQAS